jgi:serine/threonine-protein kinase RsbW
VTDVLSVTLASRLDELERLAVRVDAFGAAHQLPDEVVYAINLALDEVITNVILHGYAGTREQPIDVRLRFVGGVVHVEVEDEGRSFNPLEVPPPDLDAPIEKRRIGGLGLHIVRTMMDTLEYRREGGHNVLAMTKHVA